MSGRRWTSLHLLLLLLAMALGLCLGGDQVSSPIEIWSALAGGGSPDGEQPVERDILFYIRIPRVFAGALVGASLALAGVLMQGLFRNPLASPGVLGATAGGAFGAVLAVALRLETLAGLAVPGAAVAGTWFALFVVYALAAGRSRLSVLHLILCGVAVNTLFSAGTSLILTLSTDRYEISSKIIHWLTGALTNRGWEHVLLILPFFGLTLPLSLFLARDLNLLLTGEESAWSLGANLDRLKRRVLLLSALLTGGAVAVAGMVGFVGLVAPHILRLIQGPDHRKLLASAPLFGGTFLILCDLVSQRLIPPEEVQLGIITSLIGGPFFLFLLARERRPQ
ncbi:MAG: iron ABC transporter permease [Planctomycetes bacterium]|nr:iron ABC transporter permease [Planctomycetota bacterium]